MIVNRTVSGVLLALSPGAPLLHAPAVPFVIQVGVADVTVFARTVFDDVVEPPNAGVVHTVRVS